MNEYYTPFNYSKETSKILKGIAILMMVFLHLFNRDSQAELYTSFIMINGHSLTQCFAKACNPVGLFLFLSGYGLYNSHKLSNSIWGGKFRVINLYVELWITYIVFIPICILWSKDDRYSVTFLDVLRNVFAYSTSWNHTTWFIFPYVLILLSYGFWFRLMKNAKRVWIAFLVSLVAYYSVAIVYGRYWEPLQDVRWLLIICRYFEQLCPFLLGALVCFFSQTKFPNRLSFTTKQVLCLLLIVLCFGYSTFCGIPFYPIYCGVLMLLFANLVYKKRIADILAFWGRYSMTIWLIHTYFCDELLKSFIYGFKYPLLIFVVELAISTMAAVILDHIFIPIKKNLLISNK